MNPNQPISTINNYNQGKKNPAHVIMIIECIMGILFLIGVAALVFWFISSRSGGEEVVKCTKDGKALTQSVALTYEKDKLSQVELTYIVDKTVDEDTLSTTEQNDLMSAALSQLIFAGLDGSKGVNYRFSEQTTITTISFTADLNEMDKDEAEELAEDLIDAKPEEAKTHYIKEGFTCTIK